MPETIVVIPCYNEARRLDVDRLRRFAQTTSEIQFVLVDDGSADDTQNILNHLHCSHPDLFSVCTLPRNLGKAEAVRQGVLRALRAKPEFVAYWDADLSTPLTAIPQFRDILRGRSECQLVLGSRVALLGRHVQRKWSRHVLGRVFATLASATLGLRIYDTQCGAKMFRVSSRLKAVFREPFHSRWIFDVELLARLTCGGLFENVAPGHCVVYELPLDEWHDVSGSKLKAADFAKAAWDLAAIYGIYVHGYRRRLRKAASSAHPVVPPVRADAQAAPDPAPASSERRKAA